MAVVERSPGGSSLIDVLGGEVDTFRQERTQPRDLLAQLELDLRRVGGRHSLTANVYGAQGPCMTVVTSGS